MSKMVRMSDYVQMVEAKSLTDANGFMGKGWKLAKIVDTPDGIVYVLGLIKEA